MEVVAANFPFDVVGAFDVVVLAPDELTVGGNPIQPPSVARKLYHAHVSNELVVHMADVGTLGGEFTVLARKLDRPFTHIIPPLNLSYSAGIDFVVLEFDSSTSFDFDRLPQSFLCKAGLGTDGQFTTKHNGLQFWSTLRVNSRTTSVTEDFLNIMVTYYLSKVNIEIPHKLAKNC